MWSLCGGSAPNTSVVVRLSWRCSRSTSWTSWVALVQQPRALGCCAAGAAVALRICWGIARSLHLASLQRSPAPPHACGGGLCRLLLVDALLRRGLRCLRNGLCSTQPTCTRVSTPQCLEMTISICHLEGLCALEVALVLMLATTSGFLASCSLRARLCLHAAVRLRKH